MSTGSSSKHYGQRNKVLLKNSKLPKTVSVQFKGEDEEQVQKAFSKSFSVALFIMAVVLVTQFNSFYSAFHSICSRYVNDWCFNCPVNYRQTLWSCYDRGKVIALAGIVVKNNIVLIDTFDYLRWSTER